MNNVDLVLSLSRLVVLKTVVAFQLFVDIDLLAYPQQIILAAPVGLVDLASIDFFLRIDMRAND